MDVFVLLAVIIIPVISLLVFVGCGLQTAGGPQPTTGPFDVPVTLRIHGYHVGAGVTEIVVEFTADVGYMTRQTSVTLSHDEIVPDMSVEFPEFFLNDFNLTHPHDEGTVTCKCTVTFDGDQIDPDVEEASHEKIEGDPTPLFSLTRQPEGWDFFFDQP